MHTLNSGPRLKHFSFLRLFQIGLPSALFAEKRVSALAPWSFCFQTSSGVTWAHPLRKWNWVVWVACHPVDPWTDPAQKLRFRYFYTSITQPFLGFHLSIIPFLLFRGSGQWWRCWVFWNRRCCWFCGWFFGPPPGAVLVVDFCRRTWRAETRVSHWLRLCWVM